jgi:hypothetical protein
MKKFVVSRVYATRLEWTVEAETEAEAVAMMDDDEKTPTEMGSETWLGPAHVLSSSEMSDDCKEKTS